MAPSQAVQDWSVRLFLPSRIISFTGLSFTSKPLLVCTHPGPSPGAPRGEARYLARLYDTLDRQTNPESNVQPQLAHRHAQDDRLHFGSFTLTARTGSESALRLAADWDRTKRSIGRRYGHDEVGRAAAAQIRAQMVPQQHRATL